MLIDWLIEWHSTPFHKIFINEQLPHGRTLDCTLIALDQKKSKSDKDKSVGQPMLTTCNTTIRNNSVLPHALFAPKQTFPNSRVSWGLMKPPSQRDLFQLLIWNGTHTQYSAIAAWLWAVFLKMTQKINHHIISTCSTTFISTHWPFSTLVTFPS